ncbi:MAG: hypothetical protein AAF468_10795 [Pseudomonadota bacterium]
MQSTRVSLIFVAVVFGMASPVRAETWQTTLQGKTWHYTSGTGISSANPQIETWTTFCRNGTFVTYGKSCAPNRIAHGFRCQQFQFAGRWQVKDQGQSAVVSWQSGVNRDSYRIDGRAGKFYIRGREFKVYRPASC